MVKSGQILDIRESGYHLVVVGCQWGLSREETGEVIARDECDTHENAEQAGLMAARVYVPDFGMRNSQCQKT